MTETLRAIDKIRAACAATRRQLVVPELGIEMYFGKLTTADVQGVLERDPKTTLDRNIMLVAMKAQDVDGKPLFSMGDVHTLKAEVDFVIMQRIIDFMFDTAYPNIEKAEEEIKSDPTSEPVSQ